LAVENFNSFAVEHGDIGVLKKNEAGSFFSSLGSSFNVGTFDFYIDLNFLWRFDITVN